MAEKLTVKQKRVLAFLKKYVRRHGYPPTVRETAEHLELAGPNSVKKYLDILERKGYIRRSPRSSRAIDIIDEPKSGETRTLPIVGTIRAGEPLLAVENIEDTIALDAVLVRSEGMFLLRVQGDSMIDAHILDGDLVLVRPQATIEQGQIAAVLVGDEATVKYFFKEGKSIRLQPANPAHQALVINEQEKEIRIIGKVEGIVRMFDSP